MYDAVTDPYCYPGTTVLVNRAGLHRRMELDAFEHEAVLQRGDEPLPTGRLSVTHYLALHRHLFQDVYAWAGNLRTARIAKGGSMFCYPEHIAAELHRLFAGLRKDAYLRFLAPEEFSDKAAHFLAELNAVHPFREGNGRTQLVFLTLLAEKAGHTLDLYGLDPAAALNAMIYSFHGDERPLAAVILDLIVSQREPPIPFSRA